MTNRVPPLHPASPPPFSTLSFYEDDVDENDDFASYTIVSPDNEKKLYQSSCKTIQNAEVGVYENVMCSSSPSDDASVIEERTTSCSKDSNTLAKIDTCNYGSENGTTVEIETRNIGIDESVTIMNDSVLINSDDVSSVTVPENNKENYDFDMGDDGDDDDEGSKDLEIVQNNAKTDGMVLENSKDALNVGETEESIPLETSEENDSVVESSDDSSAVINEAAFIVVENGSDVEGDIFDDGFQEFSDYKTDSGREVINACSHMFVSLKEKHQPETSKSTGNDQFLSTIMPEPALGKSCEAFYLPSETKLVTLHNSQTFESHQNPELSTKSDRYEELMDENDDFDDFVSPPLYETHSTEQFARDSGMKLTDDNEFKKLNTKEHNSSIYATDCWSEIFEYNGEDPIEVNLNTLEGKLNGSSIWCQIKNIETSPALKFNWNESETKKLLLATLGVDLRNILFGPRWNSEVPRFASNLKFSPLVPEKASSDDNLESQHSEAALNDTIENMNSEVISKTSNGIRDAHFDWTSSGLTNPLDARKPDRLAKVTTAIIGELEYDLPAAVENSTSKRGLSAEAARILNSLPDLIVMEKQYIVFPIR